MTAAVAPTLLTVWLNDFLDPSDHIVLDTMSGLSRSLDVDGQRRVYGAGRLRSVSTAKRTRDWSITLPAMTAEQVAWLEAHADKTIVARDDRGHRIFCIYYSVPVAENEFSTDGATSLSLVELTATLAV